jgi:hypothetical protein
MARDVGGRLQRLRVRRSGIDRVTQIAAADSVELLRKSQIQEGYQRRAANRPYTRYALGAMQEVDADYTRIGLETARRVGSQLQTRLAAAGISVDFRLQGSVPLNTHIRGVSDVDLLNLDQGFFVYATSGWRSQAGLYTNPTSRTSVQVLGNLRTETARVLRDAFPATTVDSSGGKAIKISGGSLARPVDVVPSHWFDTVEYQASGQEHDRAVTILNSKVASAIDNWPFLHIKRVHDRDILALGGIKKAIRLCKNVKSDAEDEGTTIDLSSFDIAALMCHASLPALQAGAVYELAILAETQRHLDWLYRNQSEAAKLRVPDGSRAIFDEPSKLTGLLHLSSEMDDLIKEVAKEQNYLLGYGTGPTLEQARAAVAQAVIPAAA